MMLVIRDINDMRGSSVRIVSCVDVEAQQFCPQSRDFGLDSVLWSVNRADGWLDQVSVVPYHALWNIYLWALSSSPCYLLVQVFCLVARGLLSVSCLSGLLYLITLGTVSVIYPSKNTHGAYGLPHLTRIGSICNHVQHTHTGLLWGFCGLPDMQYKLHLALQCNISATHVGVGCRYINCKYTTNVWWYICAHYEACEESGPLHHH